ncbi:MAG: toll/interleukin-1 receptor domain-containing protein [Pseudomonadota bacterium]
MADVFLSYARRDTPAARLIKDQLEARGLSVFFDTEGLDSGDVFPDILDREVKTAGAVVGVWSRHALTRPWVKIECDIGRARGVLVPVQIEPIPDLDRPAAFWNVQFDDLTGFDGDTDHGGWQRFLRSLSRTLKRPDLMQQAAAPEAPEQTVSTPSKPPAQGLPKPERSRQQQTSKTAQQRQDATRVSPVLEPDGDPVRMNRYAALLLAAVISILTINLTWGFTTAAIIELSVISGWSLNTLGPALLAASALNGLVFSALGSVGGHWLHGRPGMTWASAIAIGGVAALQLAAFTFFGFGTNGEALLIDGALIRFAIGLAQIVIISALAGWIATVFVRRSAG